MASRSLPGLPQRPPADIELRWKSRADTCPPRKTVPAGADPWVRRVNSARAGQTLFAAPAVVAGVDSAGGRSFSEHKALQVSRCLPPGSVSLWALLFLVPAVAECKVFHVDGVTAKMSTLARYEAWGRSLNS